MGFKKMGEFTFNHSNQQDDLYRVLTASEIKEAFDSRGLELKKALNDLIDALSNTNDGESGGGKIGVSPIPGVEGNNLQEMLESLKKSLNETTLGQVPNGSITPQKLSFPAANGIDFNNHKQDQNQHTSEQEKLKWNNAIYQVFSVRNYGATGDGFTDDTNAIQTCINAAPFGTQVYFPPGTYIISKPIVLKESISYKGAGWESVIKQKNGANVLQILELKQRNDRTNYSGIIKDLLIDGNKANNTTGHGVYIACTWTWKIENVRVLYAPQTGIYWDGNSTIHSNTNYLRNVHVYGCGGYGVYLSQYCDDMHINGGDIGNNVATGVQLMSPSSSIRNATIWGSTGASGVVVTQDAPSVQLMNNQIEGHAGHGIEIHASHAFLNGNKIYDNANVPANYGAFSGVYVSSTDNSILQNISIMSNTIYSGLYANTGYHKHAIEFGDTKHANATVLANSIKYLGNGVVDNTRAMVKGLLPTDITDVVKDFEKIGEFILEGTTAFIEFTNISNAYKKLVLVYSYHNNSTRQSMDISVNDLSVLTVTDGLYKASGEIHFYNPSVVNNNLQIVASCWSDGLEKKASTVRAGSPALGKLKITPTTTALAGGNTFTLYGMR